MNIKEFSQGNTRVIDISGEIDLYNTPTLREYYDNTEPEIHSVILTFKDATYIDSSGIGALLYITRTAKKEKRNLYFADLSDPVIHLIELSKLNGFFPITGTLHEAFDTISAQKVEAVSE